MRRLIVVALLSLLVPAVLLATGESEESPQAEPQATQMADVDVSRFENFESQWRDPNLPDSWFDEPQTASEAGITSFSQSPFLNDRVASGELPPVAERLPDDPPVIEPYGQAGEYGGTLIMYGVDLDSDFTQYAGGGFGREGLTRARPDGQGYYNWMAEDVELLENDTVVEVTFREGLKWSDGTPFDAAETYTFYWDHILPAAQQDPTLYTPAITDIRAVDDNKVQLILGQPFAGYHYHFQHSWHHDILNETVAVGPAHVVRNYLPEFVGEDTALERAEELGFSDIPPLVSELTRQVSLQEDPRFGVPTTDAYVVVSQNESERVLERNPYYPFVDTEGNQLPYIDRIIIRFAAQRDNVELQAISGGSDILVNSARTSRIPVYLDNEDEGDYTTYIYQDAAFSKPFYVINLTPPEESARYAPYYQDVNFRRAMSLAINREQVNERFYFGRAIPMQATISPNDEAFRTEYATSYAQYDPDRARELLDEAGLEDVDGDGLREFPNGDDFVVKLMYSQALYLSAVELHEYVITNWADIGVKVEMQTVGGGTFWERSGGGQWDVKMHLLDFSMPYPMGFVMWSTPHEHPSTSPWGQFATWFRTDGEDGQRPPDALFDEASMLYDAASEYLQTLDDDALRTVLESQAENLWLIGTVGFPPKPVLVANRVKNVPENLLWDSILGAELQMMPQQWWIDE